MRNIKSQTGKARAPYIKRWSIAVVLFLFMLSMTPAKSGECLQCKLKYRTAYGNLTKWGTVNESYYNLNNISGPKKVFKRQIYTIQEHYNSDTNYSFVGSGTMTDLYTYRISNNTFVQDYTQGGVGDNSVSEDGYSGSNHSISYNGTVTYSDPTAFAEYDSNVTDFQDMFTYGTYSETASLYAHEMVSVYNQYGCDYYQDLKYTYSDEYTDAELIRNLGKLLKMQGYGSAEWGLSGDVYLSLSSERYYAEAQKMQIQVQFQGEKGKRYMASYSATATLNGGGAAPMTLSSSAYANADADGTVTIILEIDPTELGGQQGYNGGTYYFSESNVSVSEVTGSSPCCGNGPPSGPPNGNNIFGAPQVNGPANITFDLGIDSSGKSSGDMEIGQITATQYTTSPETLWINSPSSKVNVVKNTDNLWITQVQTPSGIVNVVSNSPYSYQLKFYYASDVVSTNGGVAQLAAAASPFRTFSISNPNEGTNYYAFRFTDTSSGGSTVTNEFYWSTNLNGWTGNYGNGTRYETNISSYNQSTMQRTTSRLLYSGGLLVHAETNVYGQITKADGKIIEQPIQTAVGTGSAAQTIQNTYDSNTGWLKQTIRPDGTWAYYEYNTDGLITKKVEGFKDALPSQYDTAGVCRITENSYTPVDDNLDDGTRMTTMPRMVTETLCGNVISKRYFLVLTDRTISSVCLASSASWNTSGNLITTNYYDSNWQKTRTTQPDGTLITYSSVTNSQNLAVTDTIAQGAPNAGGTAVTDGELTTTIRNSAGALYSKVVQDILSTKVLSSETYTNYDSLGRAQKVIYLDGSYVTYEYACCGLDNMTDRDGTVTYYLYDNLKRQIGTMRNSVIETNILNADGNVLVKLRMASGATNQVLAQTAYDNSGRTTWTTNALQGVTIYEYGTNNGHFYRKTTLPEGGTITNIYYNDGSLYMVLGSAAKPVRYDYGVESDGGTLRYFAYEIKLNISSVDTPETKKTYYDMANRPYKTVYGGSAVETSSYNALGQLQMKVDPDNVTTLFGYNSKGELSVTAVDVNRNGSIDPAGTDRIRTVIRDVYTKNGIDVRRIRVYAHVTDSSSNTNLLTTDEQACNGLISWQTTNDAQDVTRTNTIVYDRANGYRYVTNSAPDKTWTVSVYRYGQLQSVSQCGVGTTLSQKTYGYDAYGRVQTETDSRNGITTFVRNNADLVETVTTPMPGNGQGAQVTQTVYDKEYRVKAITYPDLTSVTNVYCPGGELALTYGSRTYPVSYGYDAQGRMTTMTNWTGFSTLAGARVTTWNYSTDRGFLTSKVYADTTHVDYTYKPSGKIQTRTWARTYNSSRICTTYAYNNAGDLYTVTYSDNTPGVTYTYDRRGRQGTVARNGITTTLSYNNASQLTGESYAGGTLAGLVVAELKDTYLRPYQVNATNGTTSLLGYSLAYDGVTGRMQTVTSGTYTSTYTYVANSPMVGQIDFKDGSTLRMTTVKPYDKLNRLSSITSTPAGAGELPLGFGSGYNSANQRNRVTLQDGSFWVYEYDSLGQVKSGKKYFADNTPVPGQQFEYVHDDIGNRTSTQAGGDQNGQNLRPASYTVNNINQYTSRTVPGYVDIIGMANVSSTVNINGDTSNYRRGEYFQKALAISNAGTNPAVLGLSVTAGGTAQTGKIMLAPGSETFLYDADGNLTNDYVWCYQWDAENRLIQMDSVSSLASTNRLRLVFEYDWRGRRIRKTVTRLDTSAVTLDNKFLYDDWNQIAELNATNNNVIRSYVWGADLSGSLQGAGGVGGLLMVKDASQGTHFAAYDLNGNMAGLVSASYGTNTARYEYGPFGEVVRMTGSMAKLNPFRFSTKYQDDETDLVYYGYRYYNASTGRWLSRDPIGERGGKNLYGFVNNEPVAHWDRLGQFPNPFKRQEPPPNNINPPPSGPFSQCKIALQCNKAVSGQDHCGLVVDTGAGVYAIDGSGGTVNSRWVTPASSSDATSSWTDNSTSVCECLFGSIKPWNENNYSRDQTQNNSNWNLKCLNKKCSVSLDWGTQQKPIGYDGKYCVKWTSISSGPPIGSCQRCDKIVDCPEDK